MKRHSGILLAVGLLLFSVTLLAQNYAGVARETGYRDGFEKGQNDARQGKSANPQRHDAWRDADHGYRDQFRNKNDYRAQYRAAFVNGYRDGYGRAGRPNGNDNRPGNPDWNRDRRDRDRNWDRGRGRNDDGSRGRGWPWETGNARNQRVPEWQDTARSTARRDGLEKGRSDSEQGKSFNVERHDAWKDADHGYRDSFGNKNAYRQEYRRWFEDGYRAGFGGRTDNGFWDRRRGEDGRQLSADDFRVVARETGENDGRQKGANDARQGKSFNPDRHDAYKDADRGYKDHFGNKEQYKQVYRDAFLRGYRFGYGRGQ